MLFKCSGKYVNIYFNMKITYLSLLFYTMSALLLRSLRFGALVGCTALRLVWFSIASLFRFLVHWGSSFSFRDLVHLSLPCPWWSSMFLVWCSSFCLGRISGSWAKSGLVLPMCAPFLIRYFFGSLSVASLFMFLLHLHLCLPLPSWFPLWGGSCGVSLGHFRL